MLLSEYQKAGECPAACLAGNVCGPSIVQCIEHGVGGLLPSSVSGPGSVIFYENELPACMRESLLLLGGLARQATTYNIYRQNSYSIFRRTLITSACNQCGYLGSTAVIREGTSYSH